MLHLTGDILMDNSSDSLCCRLGGDEFLLFIKTASSDEAEERIKKIIRDFEEKKKAGIYHVKQNGKSGYYFYNDKSDSFLDKDIDIEKLVNSIRNSGSYNGAMNVECRDKLLRPYDMAAKRDQVLSLVFAPISFSSFFLSYIILSALSNISRSCLSSSLSSEYPRDTTTELLRIFSSALRSNARTDSFMMSYPLS